MKQKAPQLSEAFIERGLVLLLRAGPTRLELATSGLTGKRPIFYTPVTTNI